MEARVEVVHPGLPHATNRSAHGSVAARIVLGTAYWSGSAPVAARSVIGGILCRARSRSPGRTTGTAIDVISVSEASNKRGPSGPLRGGVIAGVTAARAQAVGNIACPTSVVARTRAKARELGRDLVRRPRSRS